MHTIYKDRDGHIRFLQSEVFRISREEAAEELLAKALSVLSQKYIPSSEIRFRPFAASCESWLPTACFAGLYQTYVDCLSTFYGEVRKGRQQENLTNLSRVLMSLIEAANTATLRGWTVNWRQNVQWALRGSRYGLNGCSLIERFENLADRITLSERLEIIGGPIFYMQNRTEGKVGAITPTILAGETEDSYGPAFLSLNSFGGRRYTSDWIVDGCGAQYRLLSD